MRKYKLEIAIGVIFAGLLTALLWTNLGALAKPVPFVVMGLCVLALVVAVVPWPGKPGEQGAEDGERYAPKYFAQAILASVVGIAVIVGLAALLNKERFSKTFDLTERKVNSLSEETEKYIGSLDRDVEIWCVPSQNPQDRYCEDSGQLRRLYAEKSPKLAMGNLDISNTQLLSRVKPAGYGRLVLISQDNRSEVVGKVTESKLTNALINLIKTKKTVYFLVGSGEPSTGFEGGERSYAQMAEILKNRAYEVKEHNITAGDLPADANMVVAGSATVSYGPVVENMLRRVLARGGRVLLTLNPYRDPGMQRLFDDLGVKLEDTLLVNNRGATPLGAQLAQLDPMRPPMVIGEFSRESPITSVFTPRDIALADGARPMSFVTKDGGEGGSKLKHTVLMSGFHAAPVAISAADRNKIPLEGPLGVDMPSEYDPKKTYTVGLSVEIENPAKLAEGLPAATVAAADGAAIGEAAKTPGATPDSKEGAELVVLGFDVAGRYEGAAPANSQILPLAVAHLYRDKELVSIPTKDFEPKAFNLEKNPASYLFLFSGFLPIATLLTGFYIWMRRRSA
jgi:hypothetical protein